MKTASAAVLAILNTTGAVQILRSDLYTITAKSGLVLRYTDADHAQIVGGNTFISGPILKRSQTKLSVGLSVDSLQVTLVSADGTLVDGQPIIHQFRNGYFDGAMVKVQKMFLLDWADTSPGPVDWFEGRVGDVSCDHMSANFTVKAMTELLNQQQPSDVYQPTCNNTLFDNTCGASEPSFTFSGTATSITSRSRFTLSGVSQPTGYFELGKVKFTSGANTGISRTVKSYLTGIIETFSPFPYPINTADAVQAVVGCDKTYGGGCAKIGRQATGFKGYEFIPVPETAIEGGGITGTAPSSGSSGGAIVGSSRTAGAGGGSYIP